MLIWIKCSVVIITGGIIIGTVADYMHKEDPPFVTLIKQPLHVSVPPTTTSNIQYDRAGFTKSAP